MIRDKQLRLVYSLLKPALRMAAHFHVPMRTVAELVRLAYYEVLARQGLPASEIAARLGQSSRNVRSLASRLESDFFRAEKQIGLIREIEDAVATGSPTFDELRAAIGSSWREPDVRRALDRLREEGRVERGDDGRYRIGRRYVVLSSERFHHRIDALNHFLDGAFRALLQRLVHDETGTAMIKTISFSAQAEELAAHLAALEGNLRRDLAGLEESAAFAGRSDERFTLSLVLSAVRPDVTEPSRSGAGDGT